MKQTKNWKHRWQFFSSWIFIFYVFISRCVFSSWFWSISRVNFWIFVFLFFFWNSHRTFLVDIFIQSVSYIYDNANIFSGGQTVESDVFYVSWSHSDIDGNFTRDDISGNGDETFSTSKRSLLDTTFTYLYHPSATNGKSNLGNFDFWHEFPVLAKKLIFDKIFYANLDFWRKFRFLTKIPIFHQNFDFWPKLRFLMRIWIFDQNFDFWRNFRFLTKLSIFDEKLLQIGIL